MNSTKAKPTLLIKRIAASVLLTAGLCGMAAAQTTAPTVSLRAEIQSTTLPDGQTVPMWGYACGDAGVNGADCRTAKDVAPPAASTPVATTVWAPPVIRVPAGPLTINLTNHLKFGTTYAAPTSIVIVGQVGGGLGTNKTFFDNPVPHAAYGTTWPGTTGTADPSSCGTSDPNAPGNAGTFCPPPQPARIRSMATEVAAVAEADTTFTALAWPNLQPGTYLIESGTEPAIQGAMGLYGILIVTDASGTTTYGKAFDAGVPLLLSEIDPVQNREVAQVVNNTGFQDYTVWNGQPGQCGDVSPTHAPHTCFPPTVNYEPAYYLVNGVSFDRSVANSSVVIPSLNLPAAAGQKSVLLRLVNAGLHMHVPAVVGAKMTLLAEDGNPVNGTHVQNEVFMAAGKTYDVTIAPTLSAANAALYARATYPIFDRALSLSTSNQHDGGMQAYLNVAGGAITGVGSNTLPAPTVNVGVKQYSCVMGQTLSISDPSKGLLGGSTGATSVSLQGESGSVTALNLTLQADGTFTYVSPASGDCSGSFTYTVNNLTAVHTAAITADNAPVVGPILFRSDVATRYDSKPPGVLAGVKNYTGHSLLTLSGATPSGGAVAVKADGSFVAINAGASTSICQDAATAGLDTSGLPTGTTCISFDYQVRNVQGTPSNTSQAYVAFKPGSGLVVKLFDAKNKLQITDPTVVTGTTQTVGADYRWIIEEDKTFWVDPKCQVNNPTPGARVDSRGQPCPALPVESLGYNFHTAAMPVIAQGCVGKTSCEFGQSQGGTPVACDVGNGICESTNAQKTPLNPGSVYLDPNKRYFISVLPGDAVNTTIGGAGGAQQVDPKCDPTLPAGCAMRAFDIAKDCGAYNPSDPRWQPGNVGDAVGNNAGLCGHEMGGQAIAVAPSTTVQTRPEVDLYLQELPLPTAKLAVFVFEDDNPLNGENDSGGGVDVLAPNEPGLGGFEIKLFDQAGGLGDNTGQPTYDEFNQPLSNSLADYTDPVTGFNACPIDSRRDGLVGMIPTCPTFESDGKTYSPLAGQAVIANLYAGLYEVQAYPAADRIARGENWLQTNTLDGGAPHEAFLKPNEPGYFQEFGPGGFHVSIGFANPSIINSRKAAYCASAINNLGPCNHTVKVYVSNNHMSRTPDERTFSSVTGDTYSFTTCYVSVGPADAEDFALGTCATEADGRTSVTFNNMPNGTFKISVFDQWNDIMLDGLVGTITVNGDTTINFPVTQWRTNLSTQTFIDTNRNGVFDDGTDAGLALVNTNIRYRDGSFGFFNNTDLAGAAGFNEVFPFMNWLVVETTSTRFKTEAVHTVYDAGGAVDGQKGGGTSSIAANVANTIERPGTSLPTNLRLPGAVYCKSADCPDSENLLANPNGGGAGGSSGVIARPEPWGATQGWQGLLGQTSYMEFAMVPFAEHENGGINGHVIYASTRPFDDPSLLLQLSWEPGVAHVKLNLYSKTVDDSGNEHLTLVDTTMTTSWDDWAQGFRTITITDPVSGAQSQSQIPNINCPGQDNTSPFFQTLQNSKEWLDPTKTALPNNSQFKCYDGWSQLNQVQPAPYDGMYSFPSVTKIDAQGRAAGSNCTTCVTNPDANDPFRYGGSATPLPWSAGHGAPMLPPGTYVVEVVVPPGYELVKEEDKNILLGDVYIAPVSQQFAGFGNIYIMPDQAAVNTHYNANSPGSLNLTNDMGSVTFPRHEGDTGSIEMFWHCVGAKRVVPDLNSLFPGAGQAAPFAGATRALCDRKEVTVTDQAVALAKFYIFSSTHIAGHYTGGITNDFSSEFDPFSPQFGEKFAPPNLPVALRDFNGNEVSRIYADQWGAYNGLYFSTWSVNPPNPTGYAPQMAIACMNDPGPIKDPGTGAMVTDPSYNPAYSNFCYEQPFMPGFTTYMDTPVIPTQAFADNYNLPDSEYPDGTPAVLTVNGDGAGPWVKGLGGSIVSAVNVTVPGNNYTSAPNVNFNNSGTGGTGASATAVISGGVTAVNLNSFFGLLFTGGNYTAVPTVTFTGGGSGASANAFLGISSAFGTNVSSANGSYTNVATPVVAFSAPPCAINGTSCVRATGTAMMSSNNLTNTNRRVLGINVTNLGAGYTSAPTISFSTGTATATVANMGVTYVGMTNAGTGYTSAPTVGFSCSCTPAIPAAATARITGQVVAVNVTNGGSGYTVNPPSVNFSGGGGSGATATAVVSKSGTLTITALGDKVVQNPNFSGPNATTAPYNQKTITRRYSFGGTTGTVALVGSDGVARSLTGVTWTDSKITGNVPGGLPNCAIAQRGQSAAQCGELLIVRGDNGKQSIDTVTVTVGGSAPWVVTANDPTTNTGGSVAAPAGKTFTDTGPAFGRMYFSPLQAAIDNASPGDLIIVQPGTYRENLLMWKPVRLQGVGAASVSINADAHPAGKMDQWRRQVNCIFGLTLDGTPNPNNSAFKGNDPSNAFFSCPTAMYLRADRIPFEAIVGWDAAGNGNLAQVLQEPTLMGAYEGAGITVLGRGMRVPSCTDRVFGGNCQNGVQDFWGVRATGGPGAFTDGSVYLTNNNADCNSNPASSDGNDYGTGNFKCNPSRIDGVSILNSSQGGGAVFIHGWNHNLDVGNTRISGNHGTLAGGINLGNGETPDSFVNDGVECGTDLTGAAAVMPCPPIPFASSNGQNYGAVTNAAIPFQWNVKVRVHNNMIYNNASIGDALFSGTPAGAGAITISAGADDYLIDHNWMAGNMSTGDGGAVQHLGLSFNGNISHNYILFNQSTNPTLPTNGGGLIIEGANLDRTLNGQECGSTTDQDCPPGLGEGAGNSIVVDGNLILGNSAESGSGGGLRLQQINGSDVIAFPHAPDFVAPSRRDPGNAGWYDVTVTNNIIVNNVAGWDGGGVSMQDALKATFVNNTVASNDTTATAGALFKTLGAINAASNSPGCDAQTNPQAPQSPSCTGNVAQHGPQPAGLVTMENTFNMVHALAALGNQGSVTCPAGFGYTGNNGNPSSNRNDCRKLSKPILKNDLFWQNRAFSVDVVGLGGGIQSQQNLVVLTPLLNQATTGACTNSKNFRDIGLRTDDVASAAISTTANGLTINNSVYTSDWQGVLTGTANTVGGANPVVAQYCNGARVPPENCASQAGLIQQGSCNGYNTPVGSSERPGTTQLFQFSGIQPAATVDEGNNWLNLVYGPLTLGRPTVTGGTSSAEMMIASGPIGTVLGAYSIPGGSSAIARGTNTAAPAQTGRDFFGNPRSTSNDAGAVQRTAASFASIQPSALDFGSVTLNLTSASTPAAPTQTLTLTAGTTAMTGISATFSSTTAGFSWPAGAAGGTCRTITPPLAANASCTIVVQFAPTVAGFVTPTVTVGSTTGGPIAGAQVALSGTGGKVDLVVSPLSLQLGDAFVGTNSPTQVVTVTSTSSVPVTGIAFSFTGPFNRVAGPPATDCGATLNAGANCTVQVRFSPTAAITSSGTVTGSMGIAAAGFISSPATVQLNGNALLPSVSPSPLDFGAVGLGTTVTQLLTIDNGNNINSNSLDFLSIAITGLPGTGFSRVTSNPFPAGAPNCGTSLAAGAKCSVKVQFSRTTGTVPTMVVSSVVITGNAGNTTITPAGGLVLKANSVAQSRTATVAPSPLDFGSQTAGTTSAAQALTLTNTGNASVTDLTYLIGGGSTGIFTRPNGNAGGTCGNTLAIGASCTVNVRFSPATLAAYSRTLTIAGTGATITGSPVTLMGTGSGAAVTFTSATFNNNAPSGTLGGDPLTLAFGDTGGNASSVVTLSVGANPVTFGTSTLSGSGRFSLGADTCSYLTVAANNNCTIRINFNGNGNNNRTGTLTVIDSTGAALAIPLKLTGR